MTSETFRPTPTLPVLLLALLLVPALACAPAEEGGADAESAADAETAEPMPPDVTTADTLPATKGGLTLSLLEGSPQHPGAYLGVTNVEAGADLEGTSQSFDFEVSGYQLGVQSEGADTMGLANSADGQHIHWILDNDPYVALYEPTHTAEIEAGHHVLLAFLSRSWHESVKEPDAFVLTHFTVDGGEHEFDPSAPHLFYSRPKGTYAVADAQRLMLDFFLVNTELSATGNKVRATIDGTDFLLDRWAPYVIEGLQPGEVEIRLELLDAQGTLIPGPFNDVTRTVTIE